MWYLIWIIGIVCALSLSVLAAIWGDFEESRAGK